MDTVEKLFVVLICALLVMLLSICTDIFIQMR